MSNKIGIYFSLRAFTILFEECQAKLKKNAKKTRLESRVDFKMSILF
jgi:hypothetical protein